MRRNFRVHFQLLVASILLAAPALALDVKGRISGYEHLRNPVWQEARSPEQHGYSFREPLTTVPARLRKLYPLISREICIVAFGESAERKKAVTVRVAGGWTDPTTLVVLPGTEVRFRNEDPFPHQLFGVAEKTLPPSSTDAGASRRWTAQQAGVTEIRDERSPSLRTWIVAADNVAAIGFPDREGRFTISLPGPGQYSLQAYFAGKPAGKARVVKTSRRTLNITNKPLVVATKPPKEEAARK